RMGGKVLPFKKEYRGGIDGQYRVWRTCRDFLMLPRNINQLHRQSRRHEQGITGKQKKQRNQPQADKRGRVDAEAWRFQVFGKVKGSGVHGVSVDCGAPESSR